MKQPDPDPLTVPIGAYYDDGHEDGYNEAAKLPVSTLTPFVWGVVVGLMLAAIVLMVVRP